MSNSVFLFCRYWSLFWWALGIFQETSVGGGSVAMILYGVAGGLMWIRSLGFVLVQEMLGQVLNMVTALLLIVRSMAAAGGEFSFMHTPSCSFFPSPPPPLPATHPHLGQ